MAVLAILHRSPAGHWKCRFGCSGGDTDLGVGGGKVSMKAQRWVRSLRERVKSELGRKLMRGSWGMEGLCGRAGWNTQFLGEFLMVLSTKH